MNAPKTNPNVQLPPATHTTEPVPPQGFVSLQEAAGLGKPAVAPISFEEASLLGHAPKPKAPSAGALAIALAKAQGEMKAAAFNRVNPHFKSKYADLASLIDAIRGPLAKHGIAHTEVIEMEPTFRLVTTLHYGSESISSCYPLPVDGTHHELGGAITYGRRYTLSGLTGIASEEDDDATAAVAAQTKLTPEQVEHLDILVDTIRGQGTEVNLPKFYEYLSKIAKQPISRMEDIPASQFATAFAALEKKRTEKPKGATP